VKQEHFEIKRNQLKQKVFIQFCTIIIAPNINHLIMIFSRKL